MTTVIVESISLVDLHKWDWFQFWPKFHYSEENLIKKHEIDNKQFSLLRFLSSKNPVLLVNPTTFPWQLSNSLTFPDFPENVHPPQMFIPLILQTNITEQMLSVGGNSDKKAVKCRQLKKA